MRYLKNHELLNQYVYFAEPVRYNETLLAPKSHIFIVFDKDSDPDTRYCWCIKSIFENRLELWVKQTQIILLSPEEQAAIRLLYAPDKH